MSIRIRIPVTWAVVVVSAVPFSYAVANPDPPPHRIQGSPFIGDPAATSLLALGAAPSTVAVTREAVHLDQRVLEELATHRACELSLDLPDMGPVVIDIRRHIQHSDGSIGAIGTVRGDVPSRVVLELGGGLLTGDIVRGQTMVQIRQAPEGAFAALGQRADGIHLVQSAREQPGATCGNDLYDVAPPPDPNAKPPLTWGGHGHNRHDHDGDDGDGTRNPYVDVMIVYTDGARAAIGSTGAARLLGHLTLDTANEIYADSDVDHRLRMARMYEVDYDETAFDYDGDGTVGTHNDHLGTLQDDSDDVIDDVHTRRDQVGADIVTFMINDLDPGGGTVTYGLGYRPTTESTSNADTGFHTCHWENMALPTWSMPHEAGHNFGAYHDDQQIPASYVALYGCGHYWNNDAGNREKTIMARNSLGGTRLPYFSNPAVEYNGNDTGDATHDCSRMYDEVSDTISSYVTASSTTQYVDTDWTGAEDGSSSNPWDTLWEGYINVRWGGTVIMKNCEDDGLTGPIRAMLIKSTGGSSVFR